MSEIQRLLHSCYATLPSRKDRIFHTHERYSYTSLIKPYGRTNSFIFSNKTSL